MFEPIKITYKMGSPLVTYGDLIHLDSLLSWVAIHVAGYAKGERDTHEIGWEPSEPVSLPLARMHHGNLWWYRCSAVNPAGPQSVQSWTKKWDKDNAEYLDLGKATQVTITNGVYKEYHVPMQVVHCPELVYYVVGDYSALRGLAKRVRWIGKKASQGYGKVVSFEMEKLAEPSDAFALDWRTADNRPARNLPLEFVQDSGLTITGIKRAPITAPYWRKTDANTAVVAVP